MTQMLSYYLNNVTSWHADKPRFCGMVSATLSEAAGVQGLLSEICSAFDLDRAAGKQLDIIGEHVGVTRRLETPITGVFFSWNSIKTVGWNQGVWVNRFAATTGISILTDDIYRLLIRAKIAANNWDGTIEGAYRIWELLFDDISITIQDNQDMSMLLSVTLGRSSSLLQQIILSGHLSLKPAGVKVIYDIK